MKKKIIGVLSTILSICILLYSESFIYKLISIIGINLDNYSNLVNIIINAIIKLIMCFVIYLIYKKDFKKRYSSYNIIKRILLFIIYLVLLVVVMCTSKYIIDFIGDIFSVTIIEKEFYNIFDKTLNINLIIKIISDYLIVPFLYCTIILLGTEKLCKHRETFIIFSGLIASIIYAFSLNGTLIYVIINSLYSFILFAILAFIYKKENSLWMIILLYSFYLISNNIIINYLGW